MTRIAIRFAALAAAVLSCVLLLAPAGASASGLPARLVALHWAESQAGKPYVWAGAGPYGYDCSGLVMSAYAHAGISLPHNTVAMLDSGKLRWEPRRDARWGDIVLWGGSSPFHVELFAGWNGERTFGAHESGTRVGFMWYGGWWYGAESFYRVV